MVKCYSKHSLFSLSLIIWLIHLISFSFSYGSGVYFQGTTIGMAPIMSMCTAEQSGGIVMVRNQSLHTLCPIISTFTLCCSTILLF